MLIFRNITNDRDCQIEEEVRSQRAEGSDTRASGVVAVSRAVAEDLRTHFPGLGAKLHVILNPVLTPQVRKRINHTLKDCPVPPGTPWIIFVGRFVPAKGLDVLLAAFRHIVGKTSAHLVLLGDGPLRPELESMIGFQDNPLPWMREATLLVLSSRHEGLPTVLIEALAQDFNAEKAAKAYMEVLTGNIFTLRA